MKHPKGRIVVCAALLSAFALTTAQAANEWAVDSKGNITLNGKIFRVKGGSWFGLEGRQESPHDATNPGGSPMEMYMGNVFWSPSSRTLAGDALEIKNLGFNSVRIPVSPQTLNDSDPQGRSPFLKNTESVQIQGSLTALKAVVKACADAGLYVLLDMHSCSNYVGWRAGRLDARPPWSDASRDNYEFKREDCSCAATGNPAGVTKVQAYDVSKWLADLRILAGLGEQIGVDNVMGIDIFNEPWDYSWSEWRSLIDQAYDAISAVNPRILIYAQGIGGTHGNQTGTPGSKMDTPHGDKTSNPNWGENLYDAGNNPPSMPKSKLVFSPHCYGPSVCTQPMFADLDDQPECAGLTEDEFGNMKCRVVIDPARLEPGWNEHFGYLKALGYAICIGEYGGNMDWPDKSELRHQNRYSYMTDKTTDEQWQKAFVDYMIKERIYDSFYWSINPESADTYGIFKSPYDPISNKTGWGTWSGTDKRKLDLLAKLWSAADADTRISPASHHQQGAATRFDVRVCGMGKVTFAVPAAVKQTSSVSTRLYGVNGRLHSVPAARNLEAGRFSVDLQDHSVPAGTYMLVLTAGEYQHKQMVSLTK